MRNVRPSKPQLKKNSRPHRLLESLAVGTGVLVVSLLNPAAAEHLLRAALRGYTRKRRFERNVLLRDLRSLQKREFIGFQDLGRGDVKITLTEKGREKILRYNLDRITLTPSKRWDGRWRLVMFDIPHAYRMARDAFRAKLYDLRFYRIQKSVYITPHPCENEIDFIAGLFNIRDHVLIFSVDHFEGEEKLRAYFNLKF